MAPCAEYKESLLLDVYGELDPRELQAWEMHINGCEQCCEERKRVLRLIQTIKASMPAPVLSPPKAMALTASALRKLGKEQEEPWWRKLSAGMPQRLIPAIATAAVLVILVSWVTFRELKKPAPSTMASNRTAQEQLIPKDLDVIDNLEMLKEMDELTKLVQLLDKSGSESTSMNQQSKRECSGEYA